MKSQELNVWAYIAVQCYRQMWLSSANVADFIGDVEYKMWGNRHRNAWQGKQRYYDMIMAATSYPANFLVALARCRDIKVGCFVSGYDCECCPLAKKQGVCNSLGSITHFWQYVLVQDSHEEINEKAQEEMKEHLVRIWAE